MRIGILDVNVKNRKPGQCWVCKNRIEPGELHTVVIMRYGKGQQAIFRLRAAAGQAMTRKSGLKYRRLHLKDCLATWLISIHHYRTEARRERKGRPTGSGQLPQMSDDDRLVRKRLVRRRAATMRLILEEEDEQRLIVLVNRLQTLGDKMEVKTVTDMARRDQTKVRILNQKIKKVLDGQVRAG